MNKEALEEIQERIQGAKSLEGWPLCVDLCKEALGAVDIEDFNMWFSLKADLAYSLYKNRDEGREGQLEESIRIYEEILSASDVEQYSEEWAFAHMALGRAYLESQSGDICENGEKSIFHCKQSLSVFTKEEYPIDWAAIKAQLGLSYVRRMAGWQGVGLIEVIKKRRQYFLKAIEIYDEALSVFTEEGFFEEWKELTSRTTSLREALDYFDRKQAYLESETSRSSQE